MRKWHLFRAHAEMKNNKRWMRALSGWTKVSIVVIQKLQAMSDDLSSIEHIIQDARDKTSMLEECELSYIRRK
ncbi:hypothetical protein Pfo_003368 [Paulownia fortunei]|nr:hypothetical protein Pfo_003368 [Paulownia fortunei]